MRGWTQRLAVAASDRLGEWRVETLLIPGLLQTESYARAVIRGHGITDEDAVARGVEARMIRKQILAWPDAPSLWAVIDECALRKITPDLVDQLQYLLDVQRPNLRIQVLPNRLGPYAVMPGGFTILDFPEDPSCVYLEASGVEVAGAPAGAAVRDTQNRHLGHLEVPAEGGGRLYSA